MNVVNQVKWNIEEVREPIAIAGGCLLSAIDKAPLVSAKLHATPFSPKSLVPNSIS